MIKRITMGKINNKFAITEKYLKDKNVNILWKTQDKK